MRLATGVVLIAISIFLGILVLNPVNRWLSLVLVFPAYAGLLACLEGSMSFCVLHAARGTYDLNEPRGFASKKSGTLQNVGSQDWKKLDRRKAFKMHVESLTGAVMLAVLLALAQVAADGRSSSPGGNRREILKVEAQLLVQS